MRDALGARLFGVALRTWLAATSPPASLPVKRRANRIIVAGLALGVLGMVMAFSYPGIVAFFAGQALIVGGVALGRSWRHALLAIVAIAVTWLMPFVFWAINALAMTWSSTG